MANFTNLLGNNSMTGTLLRHIDDLMDTWYTGLAVVSAVDCVLGITFNIFLLLVILTSPALRGDFRNVLIVNVAVADLLVDVLCEPLAVDEAIRREWVKGCYLHIAVQLIDVCAASFVAVWGIICLDALLLTRITRLTHPLTSFLTSSLTTESSFWRKKLELGVKVAVVSLPWVMSVVVVVPIVFTGLHDSFISHIWTDERCYLVTQRNTHRMLNAVLFFLPCAVVVVLLIATVIIVFVRRRDGRALRVSFPPPAAPQTISTLESPTGSHSVVASPGQDPPSAYVVASVMTLVLLGAVHVYSLGGFGASLSVTTGMLVHLALISIHALKSTVLPLVWLLMLPDVRARARHLLAFGKDTLRRVNTLPAALDPSVAYRNLAND